MTPETLQLLTLLHQGRKVTRESRGVIVAYGFPMVPISMQTVADAIAADYVNAELGTVRSVLKITESGIRALPKWKVTKLSPAQRRLLEMMRDGAEVYIVKGTHQYAVAMKRGGSAYRPRLSTLDALERTGRLDSSDTNCEWVDYTITPAGLAALEGE